MSAIVEADAFVLQGDAAFLARGVNGETREPRRFVGGAQGLTQCSGGKVAFTAPGAREKE